MAPLLRSMVIVTLFVVTILLISTIVCNDLNHRAITGNLVMTEPIKDESVSDTIDSIKKKIVGAVNVNAKRARYNAVCESYELERDCSPYAIDSIATECSLAGVAPADCRASILPNLPNRYA